MKVQRIIFLSLLVSILFAFGMAQDQSTAISGIVRNAQGNAVEGAAIAITAIGTSTPAFNAITDKSGYYKFEHIRPGKYRIQSELRGLIAAQEIEVSTLSSSLEIDLTLLQPTLESETAAQAPPRFEAAGVRGLIDPGGYSAPAGAAAATGLIQGMADIKRPGNSSTAGVAEAWPCAMETSLKKELEVNPDQPDANRRMGEFYLAHDDKSQAIPLLERATRMNPSDSKASRDLAAALIATGQFDSAHNVLTELASKWHDAATYELLAHADEGSGKFLQASQDYQLAVNVEPSEQDFFGVGYELILAGSPNDSARVFRLAINKYPKSASLLLGLGTAVFLANRDLGALDSFLLASDLNPSDSRPYEFLAGVLKIYTGQTAKVCASFKRFMGLSPRNGEAPYFYAQCLLQERLQGNPAIKTIRVENLLKQSIALDPSLAKVHFQLAVLYEEEGNYENAAQEYETELRRNPKMKEAHYRLARTYKRLHRTQEAARELILFQEARKQGPADDEDNIEQLISVMGAPQDQGPERRCLPQ